MVCNDQTGRAMDWPWNWHVHDERTPKMACKQKLRIHCQTLIRLRPSHKRQQRNGWIRRRGLVARQTHTINTTRQADQGRTVRHRVSASQHRNLGRWRRAIQRTWTLDGPRCYAFECHVARARTLSDAVGDLEAVRRRDRGHRQFP